MNSIMSWAMFFVAVLVTLLAPPVVSFENSFGLRSSQRSTLNSTRPNIIFILTDDQDLEMGSMEYMPQVKKHLTDQGTTYNKHFCTISLCCPSRVNIWTGRLAHNTNITDIRGPYGGYSKFISSGLNNKYLPVWLQQAGYNTYYSGKLFNEHTIWNYADPYAAGWNESEFLLDPHQYLYDEPIFARNHDEPINYPGNYSTDMVGGMALGFLDDAVAAGSPFFLGIAPIASHATVTPVGNDSAYSSPPVPAKRHQNLFPNATVPRAPNFNPDKPSGSSWLLQLPQLNSTEVASNDEWYRDRLRSLQAVDEMVDQLVQRLDDYSILDNTYIFYTTDNGYHIGQHRLQPGKTCPYETDVHIPLIIRGPGIAQNASTDVPTSHTDLAPTIFEIFGIPARDEFDGSAIPLTPADFANEEKTAREHVGLEFWNNRNPDETGPGLQFGLVNTTYKAMRVMGDGYSLYYSVWCENLHELYDMTVDYWQMNNLFVEGFANSTSSAQNGNTTILGVSIYALASRLDGLLLVLKSCQAESCRAPWTTLMPNTGVSTLRDALAPEYDDFFQTLPKVSYTACEPGYIISAEGPQFQDLTLSERRGADPDWAMWT